VTFKVPYMILANSAQELTKGKINILGTFDRLWPNELPGMVDQMAVVALITCDSEDDLGDRQVTVRLVRPTGQLGGEFAARLPFRPQGGSWFASQRLILNLRNVGIREFGKHVFQILVADQVLAEHPLTVVEARGE